MDILDHSDEGEEQTRCTSSSRSLGSRFGRRRATRRSASHQHLLLMDCVGGSDNGDASEETVPLPDYERLSQSARIITDDPDYTKDPPPPTTPVQQPPAKTAASSPQLPPAKREEASSTQQQKPAAWRLIEYVRSRNRAGGAPGGCGVGSDGDSKSSDGEKEGEDCGEEGKKDKKKIKKRSSWLPDPDRRWPVQGFY